MNYAVAMAVGVVGIGTCLYCPGAVRGQTADYEDLRASLPERYQVEVIVFRNNDFDPNDELLDVNYLHPEVDRPIVIPDKIYFDALSQLEVIKQVEAPILPGLGEARQLPPFSDDLLALEMFARDGTGTINLRVLNRDELQMGDLYARLERLSAYTPLVHGGWVQDEVDENLAVPVDLSRLDGSRHLGTITLHVSRFLHVTLDLQYRPEVVAWNGRVSNEQSGPGPQFPFDDRNVTASQSPTYVLQAERRILRGEINYIDHPAFGVIVLITLEPELDRTDDASAGRVVPAA